MAQSLNPAWAGTKETSGTCRGDDEASGNGVGEGFVSG